MGQNLKFGCGLVFLLFAAFLTVAILVEINFARRPYVHEGTLGLIWSARGLIYVGLFYWGTTLIANAMKRRG